MGTADYSVARVTRVGEAATVHLTRRADAARFRVMLLPKVRIEGVHRVVLDAYSGESMAVATPPWTPEWTAVVQLAREAATGAPEGRGAGRG